MLYEFLKNRQITRDIGTKLSAIEADERAERIRETLDYFDRDNAIGKVLSAYTDRYAVDIRKQARGGDTVESGTGYEVFYKPDAVQALRSGLHEAISTAMGPRIALARASLFNQKGSGFTFTGATESASQEVAEHVTAHRKAGGFGLEMIRADYIASAIESCAVHVGWKSGHLSYRIVTPDQIWFCSSLSVSENTSAGEYERSPDRSDIEDCACVVVLLSTGQNHTGSANLDAYRAYFGRSLQYPQGRMVDYLASKWSKIPNPGTRTTKYDGGILHEYLANGEPANPLTVAGSPVEYPISMLRGGVMMSTHDIAPTTDALYRLSLEIDIAWSRTVSGGLRAVRGIEVIKDQRGVSPIPRTLNEGKVVLHKDQDLEILGRSVTEATGMSQLLQGLVATIAASYSVPDYYVKADAYQAPTSGVALAIRTQPLISDRQFRVGLNDDAVGRLWQIERAMISFFGEREIPDSVVQAWNPGELELPTDPMEQTNIILTRENAKYIAHSDAIRAIWGVSTEGEASEIMERIDNEAKERAAMMPQATAAPTLAERLAAKIKPRTEG